MEVSASAVIKAAAKLEQIGASVAKKYRDCHSPVERAHFLVQERCPCVLGLRHERRTELSDIFFLPDSNEPSYNLMPTVVNSTGKNGKGRGEKTKFKLPGHYRRGLFKPGPVPQWTRAGAIRSTIFGRPISKCPRGHAYEALWTPGGLTVAHPIIQPASRTLHCTDVRNHRFSSRSSPPAPLVALLSRRLSLKATQSPKHPTLVNHDSFICNRRLKKKKFNTLHCRTTFVRFDRAFTPAQHFRDASRHVKTSFATEANERHCIPSGVCGLFPALLADNAENAGPPVAERLGCAPPTNAKRVQSPVGSLPDFCKQESCQAMRWSAGFLEDIPYPPPLHSGAVPFSSHFTPIGSLTTQIPQLNVLWCCNCQTTRLAPRQTGVTSGFSCIGNMAGAPVGQWVVSGYSRYSACLVPRQKNRQSGGFPIQPLHSPPGCVRLPLRAARTTARARHRGPVELPRPSVMRWTWTGAATAFSKVSLPPTKANRVQSPARSTDFHKWESCRTMSLVGGFSRASPVSAAPSFRHRSILTSISLIGSQDLTVKSHPNLFTHSKISV
ncbi:hypothetical protein PR048_032639 [Dryococelus australis]|uniref:Uncharacterized protein n=1 Tax=Dryococelus australis TaxID=614101 RepID=A0ABQ9G3J4_9NEOP|nr:hypothetical protein PR048_032639 [Dryococelus australis]